MYSPEEKKIEAVPLALMKNKPRVWDKGRGMHIPLPVTSQRKNNLKL